MESIGVLLPHLGSSQKSYTSISYINHILTNSALYDFVLFYENLVNPCIKPLCAVMNISEIWSFDGILISTTLDNTSFAIKSIKPRRKLFYIWDLEWERKHDFNYNINIYRSQEIELIARSISHQNAIENYCNRKVNAVIPDFNLYTMLDYIGKTNERTRNITNV